MGRPRFTKQKPPFFRFTNDESSSPRKKTKFDIRSHAERWAMALDQVIEAIVEDDDGLPSAAFAFHNDLPSAPSKKAKKNEADPFEDLFNSGPSASSSTTGQKATQPKRRSLTPKSPTPEADILLEIPGEPIYAKEKEKATEFWPAKILEFVPPTGKNQKQGKYKIVFFDGKEKVIPREWFYIVGQDGFAEAKVGLLCIFYLVGTNGIFHLARRVHVEHQSRSRR
jgi:hypothetical protein